MKKSTPRTLHGMGEPRLDVIDLTDDPALKRIRRREDAGAYRIEPAEDAAENEKAAPELPQETQPPGAEPPPAVKHWQPVRTVEWADHFTPEEKQAAAERRAIHASILRARDLLADCVSRADWEAMIAAQVQQAREGDLRAFSLLLEYAFGRPGPMDMRRDVEVPKQSHIITLIPPDLPIDERVYRKLEPENDPWQE